MDKIVRIKDIKEVKNMENEINKALYKEKVRVLKELLSLGIEFSKETLSDISGLTRNQIEEVKKELSSKE